MKNSPCLFSSPDLYREIDRTLTPSDRLELKAMADAILKQPLQSITSTPFPPPPGATVHDYATIGKYCWPNPDTPTGLPWILRDGRSNPWLLKHCAHGYSMRMFLFVTTLAAAGHFLEDRRYFARAAEQLKYFFFLPETRMNPSLSHLPKAPGIIEQHFFCELLEAVATLPEIPEWGEDERKSFRDWCEQYLDGFLLTHPLAIEERGSVNNHGIWFDAQLIAFALFLGRTDLAVRQIRDYSIPRMDGHFSAEGRILPEEHRTISLFYSYFNLQGWAWVAGYARMLGMDLYHRPNRSGMTLVEVLKHHLDYFFYRKPWPLLQIKGRPRAIEYTRLFSMFDLPEELPECARYLADHRANPVWRLPALIPGEEYQQLPPEPCDRFNIPEEMLPAFESPEEGCGCPPVYQKRCGGNVPAGKGGVADV